MQDVANGGATDYFNQQLKQHIGWTNLPHVSICPTVSPTASSASPCQDNDSSGKEKRNFSTFLQRNDFGYLKKPVPKNNLKITIK